MNFLQRIHLDFKGMFVLLWLCKCPTTVGLLSKSMADYVSVVFPTCVSLSVTTEGPFRRPVTPIFSSVSVSGSPALLRYGTLHVVVVCPSFVSVSSPRPAVAQRWGRALHGTAVVDGLREKERERDRRGREGERGREARRGVSIDCRVSVSYEQWGKRCYVYVCMCACVWVESVSWTLCKSPLHPPTPHPISHISINVQIMPCQKHRTCLQLLEQGSAKSSQWAKPAVHHNYFFIIHIFNINLHTWNNPYAAPCFNTNSLWCWNLY